MLRPYLPTWIKEERTEFALDMASALILTVCRYMVVGMTIPTAVNNEIQKQSHESS